MALVCGCCGSVRLYWTKCDHWSSPAQLAHPDDGLTACKSVTGHGGRGRDMLKMLSSTLRNKSETVSAAELEA